MSKTIAAPSKKTFWTGTKIFVGLFLFYLIARQFQK